MSMTMRIGELAEQALVSRRTIRYYVQMGLLPPPEMLGAYSAYGREHLIRLLLIQRLQGLFWPLDRIRRTLEGLTIAQLETFLENERWPEGHALSRGPSTEALAPVDGPATDASGTAMLVKMGLPLSRKYYRLILCDGLELHYAESWHAKFSSDSDLFSRSLLNFLTQFPNL